MFNQIKLDIQKLISGKNEVMYMKIKKKKTSTRKLDLAIQTLLATTTRTHYVSPTLVKLAISETTEQNDAQ